MQIQIKLEHPFVPVPLYATSGAAAMDFVVPRTDDDQEITYWIAPGHSMLIPTGVRMAIPDGYALFLMSRSGHGAKYKVTLANSVGLIDSDYRGEVIACVINHGAENFYLKSGDRFAQGVIQKVETAELIVTEGDLPATLRGDGGFGSTGK